MWHDAKNPAKRVNPKLSHGHSRKSGKSLTYASWENMLQRCHNKRAPNFHLYGGRGITVCKRWRQSFKNFLEDMGERPGKPYEYVIDRISPSKNYTPSNCRWITRRDNSARTTKSRNRRGQFINST